jgi:hypothetical protein
VALPRVVCSPPVHHRSLAAGTVAYLALPVALFLAGWLRAPWSLLAVAALAWAAVEGVLRLPGGRGGGGGGGDRRDRLGEPGRRGRLGPIAGLLAGLLAGTALLALVVALLGAGGVGPQAWDWVKHEAVLADLVAQDWPVTYRLGPPAGDLGLVYYVAYYLPAALVGRLAGWPAAHAALFAWTVAGVVLAWRWVARLGRAPAAVALAVVVLASGFDVLGAAWAGPRFAGEPWWRLFDLEWWQGRFVFPSNVSLLAYAPHQALGGWLATALCLEALRRGARRFPLALPPALCLLWSPFAALGAAVLVALTLLGGRRGRRRLARRLRAQMTPATLATLLFALPIVLFYLARLPAPELPGDLVAPEAARRHAALAFLPARLGLAAFVGEWGLFLAVELAPLVAALAVVGALARRRRGGGAGRFHPRLLFAAALLLVALPAVGYGYYGDFAMRTAIPPLFALQVVAARRLADRAAPAAVRAALALVLLVAALYPLAQLRLQAERIAWREAWVAVPPRAAVDDLFAQQRGPSRHFGFVEQYVASVERPFYRWLATRPLVPRAVPPAAPVEPPGQAVGSATETRSN